MTAAPTGKPEYGAYARSIAARASRSASSISACPSIGSMLPAEAWGLAVASSSSPSSRVLGPPTAGGSRSVSRSPERFASWTVIVLTGAVFSLNTVPAVGRTVTPTCHGRKATIVGTPGNDLLRGTRGADVIVGLGGNDIILGKGGDDVICGNGGDDELIGFSGNDILLGGSGFDGLFGVTGDDQEFGGRGRDLMTSGGGDVGRDILNGGAGNDALLSAGPGGDRLWGGPGSSTMV